MKTYLRFSIAAVFGIVVTICTALLPSACQGIPITAYSLGQAASHLRAGRAADAELQSLGGITRLLGFVVDPETKDIVLVGANIPRLPPIILDDLVVALRALEPNGAETTWPEVSIDPDAQTGATKLQRVRFLGGIENTGFGLALLQADVALKRYSLGLQVSNARVPSYRDLCARDFVQTIEQSGCPVNRFQWLSEDVGKELEKAAKQQPAESASSYSMKFWFVPEQQDDPKQPDCFLGKGVCCIKELRLSLMSQQTAGDADPQSKSHLGESFARNFEQNFDKMAAIMPELLRLKGLFDLVCISGGVRLLQEADNPNLEYLLRGHQVRIVRTPSTFPLQELRGVLWRKDSQAHLVYLSGGIQLKAEIAALQEDNDWPVLRDIVLKSRTNRQALTWRLPLDEWKFQNSRDLRPTLQNEHRQMAPGCSVKVQSVVLSRNFSTDGLVSLAKDRGPSPIVRLDVTKMSHHVPEYGSSVEEHNQHLIDQQGFARMKADGQLNTIWFERTQRRLESYDQKQPQNNNVGPLRNGAFQGFSGGVNAPPVKGVSMKMLITESNFTQDKGGSLRRWKEGLLKSRQGEDTLSWPANR